MDVFAANDLAAFSVVTGTPTEATTSGRFDSTYAAKYIQCASGSSIKSARFIDPDTGSNADLTAGWVHFEMNVYSWGTSGGSTVFQILNSSGTAVLRLIFGDSIVRLDYWNGSAWVAGAITASSAQFFSALKRLDFQFECGATGFFRMYVNESFDPYLELTSLDAAVDNAAYITLTGPSIISGSGLAFSQILVSEESTIGAKVGSLTMGTNGTNTAWTGDTTNINKTGITDTNFITPPSNGDKETFVCSDTSLPYISYSISSVWLAARGRRGTTTPENFEGLARVSGTDYGNGYNFPNLNTTTFGPSLVAWSLNPATVAAWDLTAVNALELGFEATT